LDALVTRTSEALSEMVMLASQNEMAVINAMSENEHPTQAMADLLTMKERFGRLEGLSVLYVGEGNNSAAALALALSRIPQTKLAILTPQGYGLPEATLTRALSFARHSGAVIDHSHDIDRLPGSVDVVYTTRWETTGTTKADPHWKQKFRPFAVTPELMAKVSRDSGTVFMHDLPAVRGEDVHADVLDGPQSIAFRQARNKLFSAMAVLEWCILGI